MKKLINPAAALVLLSTDFTQAKSIPNFGSAGELPAINDVFSQPAFNVTSQERLKN